MRINSSSRSVIYPAFVWEFLKHRIINVAIFIMIDRRNRSRNLMEEFALGFRPMYKVAVSHLFLTVVWWDTWNISGVESPVLYGEPLLLVVCYCWWYTVHGPYPDTYFSTHSSFRQTIHHTTTKNPFWNSAPCTVLSDLVVRSRGKIDVEAENERSIEKVLQRIKAQVNQNSHLEDDLTQLCESFYLTHTGYLALLQTIQQQSPTVQEFWETKLRCVPHSLIGFCSFNIHLKRIGYPTQNIK